MSPIRIGVIGAGIFVRETYIPNIEDNSNLVKLTAIVSKSFESIEEVSKLLKNQDTDFRRFAGADGEDQFFLEASDICDAVIIAVPIPLLGHYIERCISLNLHILSEKPVAMTSVYAQRLISKYHENLRPGKPLWHVAENYRLEPAVQYASELVRRHSMAPKTFTLTVLRQQSATSKFAVTSWRKEPEYNGSVVFDGN